MTRGAQAEQQALDYLLAQGLRLVERNFRCRGGEIDLIMREGEQLVFVEVRYRRSARYGGALASVDRRKQGRLITAALHYLQRHRTAGATRFDVVALEGETPVQWVRNAFEAA
jgi:putative endonuclease